MFSRILLQCCRLALFLCPFRSRHLQELWRMAKADSADIGRVNQPEGSCQLSNARAYQLSRRHCVS